MACKGQTFADIKGAYERTKEFLADYSKCPKDIYTDEKMYGIMFETMCDYLDSCDKPSFFMREMDNVYKKEERCFADIVCCALQMVEVKESNADGEFRFVNGFTAEMFES